MGRTAFTELQCLYKGALYLCGPGSSVGIANGYGLDGPGIESRWGEIFRSCPYRPYGLPSLLYNGYLVFPGGEKRPGRDAHPSHLIVPCSRKSRAIRLLTLWTVRHVQSHSTCTRVHFTLLPFMWKSHPSFRPPACPSLSPSLLR